MKEVFAKAMDKRAEHWGFSPDPKLREKLVFFGEADVCGLTVEVRFQGEKNHKFVLFRLSLEEEEACARDPQFITRGMLEAAYALFEAVYVLPGKNPPGILKNHLPQAEEQ